MNSGFEEQAGVVAIGVDILNASRIAAVLTRHGHRFVQRVLTPAEQQVFQTRANKENYLAKQYAAKEALAKALGTGIAKGIGFQQLEVLRDEQGAPQVKLYGAAAERLAQLGAKRALISLSDEGQQIVAFALLSRS